MQCALAAMSNTRMQRMQGRLQPAAKRVHPTRKVTVLSRLGLYGAALIHSRTSASRESSKRYASYDIHFFSMPPSRSPRICDVPFLVLNNLNYWQHLQRSSAQYETLFEIHRKKGRLQLAIRSTAQGSSDASKSSGGPSNFNFLKKAVTS